jgi:hypothetical protein
MQNGEFNTIDNYQSYSLIRVIVVAILHLVWLGATFIYMVLVPWMSITVTARSKA